ncbi:MAG: UDP-N-acetylmuramate dehydrogenase [Archangiaceae bacterium]|nr:UDP-N-acetylmuramate dehydrogenase [Archangiaceae bacterium]
MPARSHPLSKDVTFDVPLAKWTSVRVGGSAEALVKPSHPDVLVQTLAIARQEGLTVSVLGGGANTLVGDGGVPGVTVKLPSAPEEIDGDKLTFSAGTPIARLVTVMKAQQRVGAEFLAGIPGTLGGATAMNAGTKNGECMRIVDGIELCTADGLGWVTGLPFVYRHTSIPQGAIITRIRFKLPQGDLAESQQKMDADLAYRKSTQPLDKPNFGSVFTNPPGHAAGRLIESVQLKGHRIGDAQISTVHANWIVNLGKATARDVVALMELAQSRVRDATGVTLQPEVKRIGVF